jgi:hypothetical protein
MKEFEINKTYRVRSVCDYDCFWDYKVISRTAKTITIIDISRELQPPMIKRIYVFNDTETVKPDGSYSMAPILRADKLIPSKA